MAAVSVPSLPRTSAATMSTTTRRTPLADLVNGANSPHRPSLVPAKRARTANATQPDDQPPLKKAATVDNSEVNVRSPSRARGSVSRTDSKPLSRRCQPAGPEKKLALVKGERPMQLKAGRNEKASTETVDTIRQWQKHYRRAFPHFVFYFDSVPEEARNKCSRQVASLGAHEEKFFSRLVTHVVTCRPIPRDADAASPTESNTASITDQQDNALHTVNPSMLDKGTDTHLHLSLRNEARRDQNNTDVLYRARQMGIKIWAFDKLQRVIATINDEELGVHVGNHPRGHNDTASLRAKNGPDLTQVLKNELQNGPSDRDPLSSMKEMVYFKGPFIYVRDMNEKTKPVIVREYPKVANPQDGDWPQFRCSPLGRCPFVNEQSINPDKEVERIRLLQKQAEQKAAAKARHDNLKSNQNIGASQHTTKQDEPLKAEKSIKQAGGGLVSPRQKSVIQKSQMTKEALPRKGSESMTSSQYPRTGSFYTTREPAASGVQPSNVTSAIRSQMVSSTAAAPGAKAGLSKEVHELKRKVLEKNSGGISTAGMPPLHGAADAKSRSNTLSKTNPHEKPSYANEDDTLSTAMQHWKQTKINRQLQRERQQEQEKEKERAKEKEKQRMRDPKPGYCENCREKFNDFEEHTETRKHRKFALNQANWVELDELLKELHRPLKPGAYKYVTEITKGPPRIRRPLTD